MFSHGFMSFAAIGITVACLLIMGTFSLVAYNADYNLKNLQKENAVLAFIDESLTEDQARALQGKVEAVPNVADATFVSREQARDSYAAGKFSDAKQKAFQAKQLYTGMGNQNGADGMQRLIEQVDTDMAISNGLQ